MVQLNPYSAEQEAIWRQEKEEGLRIYKLKQKAKLVANNIVIQRDLDTRREMIAECLTIHGEEFTSFVKDFVTEMYNHRRRR